MPCLLYVTLFINIIVFIHAHYKIHLNRRKKFDSQQIFVKHTNRVQIFHETKSCPASISTLPNAHKGNKSKTFVLNQNANVLCERYESNLY